jgi:hypothetical protein
MSTHDHIKFYNNAAPAANAQLGLMMGGEQLTPALNFQAQVFAATSNSIDDKHAMIIDYLKNLLSDSKVYYHFPLLIVL